MSRYHNYVITSDNTQPRGDTNFRDRRDSDHNRGGFGNPGHAGACPPYGERLLAPLATITNNPDGQLKENVRVTRS